MKIRIFAILMLCCFTASNVFAGEIYIRQSNEEVSVSGTIDLMSGNELVSLMQIEKGAGLSKSTLAFSDIQSSSGSFDFNFKVGGATKTYTVFVTAESSGESVSKDFVYVGTTDLQTALDIINNASSAAAMKSSLQQIVQGLTVAALLGIDVDSADELAADTEAYQYLVDNRPYSAAGISEIADLFDVGIIVRGINELTSAADMLQAIEQHGAKLGLFETGTDSIIEEHLTEKIHVGERLVKKDLKNLDILKDVYAEAVILAACQHPASGRFTIEEVLELEKARIGIVNEWATYSSLSATSKVWVISQIQVTDTTDLDTLRSSFAAAVAAKAGESGGTSSSPGGGSGGGGGGGGSSNTNGVLSTGILADIGTPTESAEQGFSDMSGAPWAEEAVNYLSEKGVLAGRGNGIFAPNDMVTREEFVKMIVTALEIQTGNEASSFADTSDGAWYNQYINAALELGIVNGIGENQFGVGQNITREDLVVMCHRGIGANFFESTEANLFTDDADIAEYAKASVTAFYANGIVSGYENGAFLPKNTASRAEAAKIIYELIKNL